MDEKKLYTLLVTSDEGATLTLRTAEEATLSPEEQEKLTARFHIPAGRYVLKSEKEGFHSCEQMVQVESDRSISLFLVPLGGEGYEPSKNEVLFAHEEAPWERFAPERDLRWAAWEKVYTTPAFTGTGSGHRITTREELEAFADEVVKTCPHLHPFAVGKTEVHAFPLCAYVFAKGLPRGLESIEEGGKALEKTGRPTVYHQAQIHGNETSPGEAALAMMAYLASPEGERLLDKINVCILPRLNPEGALLFCRQNGKGLDLNRDFFALKGAETRIALRVFLAVKPVLVIDGHELRTRNYARCDRYEDIQLSSGVGPNADPAFYDGALALLDHTTKGLGALGFQSFFYRDHVSGSTVETGTRVFAERGAITVLVEGKGHGLGKGRYRRRVMAQFSAVRLLLEKVAAEAEHFAALSARERESFLHPFPRPFVTEGAYTFDPETDPAYPVTLWDFATGEALETKPLTLPLYRRTVRSRPRPASYLLPAGKEWEQALKSLLDAHRILYRTLPPTTLTLTRFVKEEGALRLAPPKEYVFEEGAIEIPTAQEASRLVSFLLEADCTDSQEGKQNLSLPALFSPEGDFDVYRKER